jgi:hypothetical protein
MSHDLEIPVNGLDDEERIIVVTDWTLSKGSKGHSYPTYDCGGCPPEPASLDDIQCHFQDTGKELTQEEWDRYGETIDEKCWDRVTDEAEAAEDDAADQAYERMRDREVA